jgi:hypothetical protein
VGCPHFPDPLTAVSSPMLHRGLHRVSPLSTPSAALVRLRSADVAQSVEHLFCKQAVRGSSPLVSSVWRGAFTSVFLVGCPSGQREQAVNLPEFSYVGSNPTPTTSAGSTCGEPASGLHRRGHSPRPAEVNSAGPWGPCPKTVRALRLRRRPQQSATWGVARVAPSAPLAARSRVAASLDFAGVAQLVERQPSKLNVEGSSPFSRSVVPGTENQLARCASGAARLRNTPPT